MDAEDLRGIVMSRRSALKRGAATAFLLSQAALFEQVGKTIIRPTPAMAATTFPDIQFDLGAFINPAVVLNDGAGNVTAQFRPTYTMFLPATLNRTPTVTDQTTLADALNTIEANYEASPSGLLIFSVSYGVPYFNLLPQSLVSEYMPQTLSYTTSTGTLAAGQSALVEATPMPTDVVDGLVGGPNAVIPNVVKERFNVNVVIESNHVLFHLSSDSMVNLAAIPLWFTGSNNLNGVGVPSPDFNGLFTFGTPRIQFMQIGMPATLAQQYGFEFAGEINPDSSMAMGFIDQQTNASGPAQIVTFAGNSSAVLTNAVAGDYFDNGSIAHLSHNIQDLYQFYNNNFDPTLPNEPFTQRCAYLFRANQLGTTSGLPATGNTDQFTNGGGPAYINNVFQGTGSVLDEAQDTAGTFSSTNATEDATFFGTGRVGHINALQRVSRASDTTPLHVRADGPGLDTMDVPAFETYPGSGSTVAAGSYQFKLQFLIYVPTGAFFAQMRTSQAAQDLQHEYLDDVALGNGIERFITSTRRQNFLVPPRRHRAFPLVELA
jgi:hypothetical protein